MDTKQTTSHLRVSTVIMRIISVCSCAFGASASVYSLLIQFNETGNIQASICWFAGLFALIAGISGYAVTNLEKRKKNYTWVAVCVAFVLGIAIFIYEKENISLAVIINTAIICVIVQGIALIIAHFVLKKRDPYAL